MSAQHQQAHLGRLQAAGMASMFPPNPMFNLHPPTTPPKQASSQSVSRGVTGSNPQYASTTSAGTSHRSATSLARLQQLTNGLENTPGAGVSAGAAGVPTPSVNSGGNSIPGAKPSKQNSALLAPSYYPPAATPGQQPGQPQSTSHHSQSPGVPSSIPASHARPETPASRNHQNLIAHQYSQNHMALNYPGYPPGYLNPWNMYHQAAAEAHQHQRSVSAAAAHHQATHSAVSGVPGSNPAAPPHHHAHQMYPGYPGLPGYNYHR